MDSKHPEVRTVSEKKCDWRGAPSIQRYLFRAEIRSIVCGFSRCAFRDRTQTAFSLQPELFSNPIAVFSSRGRRMKYVLRNITTGRYLKRSGVWVLGIDEAMSFDEVGEAREFCQAHRLDDAQPVQLLMPYLMSLLAVVSGPAVGGS